MKGFLATIYAWGPLGVLVISIFDSAGIPMVSGVDALIVLVAIKNPAGANSAAAMAILGSLAGSLTLFFVARKGGEAYLERYTKTPQGVRLKRWFQEYGLLTVFVPALIPIPMPLKLFVIASGALGVHPAIFTLVLALARIPRYFGFAYLGKRLGNQTLPFLTHHIWQLVAISVALFALLYLAIKFLDPGRKLRKVVSETE
ncbi:MAG TPA: VTT domain-containing protein [Bryobacteraceae bacterium]|nr:VTT domain-containing protein [Bryobacteraceae bacterium]